ncbi:MAG: MBL fold metallo-hydrolase [Deltaproteobacteria bacterium]|nr:MBL fold metallo-hydrolase [Deltaproteobacteria bacterium]
MKLFQKHGDDNAIFVLYDNRAVTPDMIPAWGFSCLIFLSGHAVLFDTGGDPDILRHNIEAMDLDLHLVSTIILSHGHGDHVGGLSALLGHSHPMTVYFPRSFPKGFEAAIRRNGAVAAAVDGFTQIHPDLYTTGEMGVGIKEQSLVLRTIDGLVIITGCAHPGIVETVEAVNQRFGEQIHLFMGGFHLMGQSSTALTGIARRLEALDVVRIAPCHCSGDATIDFFEARWKINFISIGAGSVVPIPAPLM